jgi:hypothetical protein
MESFFFADSPLKGVPDIPVTHLAVLINPVSSVKTLYVTPAAQDFEGLENAESKALRVCPKINFPIFESKVSNHAVSITRHTALCFWADP